MLKVAVISQWRYCNVMLVFLTGIKATSYSRNHETLYKRKSFLDSFSEGLQVLGVKDMIRHFPDVFKPAFVFSGQVTPAGVLKNSNLDQTRSEMSENIKRV